MGIISGAIWVLSKAIQEIQKVDMAGIGKTALVLVGFTAAMFGLGKLVTGPGGVIFALGAAAISGMGLAIGLLGVGLGAVGEQLPKFTNGLKNMVDSFTLMARIPKEGKDAIRLMMQSLPIDKLKDLAAISDKLRTSALAIRTIADSFSTFTYVDGFSTSINNLTTSLEKLSQKLNTLSFGKLENLNKSIETYNRNLQTMPFGQMERPPQELGKKADREPQETTITKLDTAPLEKKVDELISLMRGGYIVARMDKGHVHSSMATLGT
jgi:hypothetical protein